MKTTRQKLVGLWNLIDMLMKTKSNIKFYYLLSKNKRLLEPEIKCIYESQEMPSRFAEYEKKRISLCSEYADKDPDGKPITTNNQFSISKENISVFEEELAKLKLEYIETLAQAETIRQQFSELMDEEIEIELTKIPMSLMPDTIAGTEIDILYDLIDEEK